MMPWVKYDLHTWTTLVVLYLIISYEMLKTCDDVYEEFLNTQLGKSDGGYDKEKPGAVPCDSSSNSFLWMLAKWFL